VVVLLLSGIGFAQAVTVTGSVSGTVTDPSGAVIANANLALTSTATGATRTTKSNTSGYYTFQYVPPGQYKLTTSVTGFATASQLLTVAVGAEVSANIKMALAGAQEVVEVTGEAGAIQTENANLSTTFNSKAVEMLPNNGNDLTGVALTAPGVVMNTNGNAYGNYSVYGLPGTSNQFTIDSASDNDPYFQINNSGATNLTLGLNDISETAVVSNAYSGQYGGLAGANINYVTKSGGNNFHGNMIYWWNGDNMDGNSYFFNQAGTPRPRVNSNQYAGSLGGPIKKDKAFFFFDYEALRLVIPAPYSINVPTAAFQSAVLAGLPASEQPVYKQIFSIFNNSGVKGTLPLPNGGCGTAPGNYTGLGPGGVCAQETFASKVAHTNDYLATGRVDYNIGSKDRMFVRVNHEHGLQATYTDPLTSAFNEDSDQPEWSGEFNETHTFGSNKVNSVLASMTWYSASFVDTNPQASFQTLPFGLYMADGSLGVCCPSPLFLPGINTDGYIVPQGRNITQYQFSDDFSWTRGKHTIKFGVSYKRYDVNDQNVTLPGVTPLLIEFSLADFAAGGVGPEGDENLNQNFTTKAKVPIRLYQVGGYVDDEIKVTPNLKLTLSLRGDHPSDPVCVIDCFQRFATPFQNPSAGFPLGQNPATTPVNQAILANQKNAFPSVTGLIWQPKVGFAWSPFGSKKTVVRGGGGVFLDAMPTGVVDSFLVSPPLAPVFTIFNAPLGSGPAPYNGAGTLVGLAQAENAAFATNFPLPAPNGLGCTFVAAGKPCVPQTNFFNSTPGKPPRYYEWSLEVQRDVGWKTTVSAKYVGNHGSFIAMNNAAENGFGFPGLDATVPDGRFLEVQQIRNLANSNYNGLTVSAQHAAAGGFQFQANYTYSHGQDETSNGGVFIFSGQSLVLPEDPSNIRRFNYGNSDYDLRHYFSMNYVWSDSLRHLTHWGPNALMKGWNVSGTIFWHTGFPFTVTSSTASFLATFNNYFNTIFGQQTAPINVSCSSSAAQINNPCLGGTTGGVPNDFVDPAFGAYGNTIRNAYRGPGFFDTDMGIEKAFDLPKWEGASFSIGARAFNLFNHPNFATPISNVDDGRFGKIINTASPPTSIYGAFLGANASPRLVQIQAKLVF
jgi:hypothetical protein